MLKGLYSVVAQVENISNNLCYLGQSDALSEQERATILQLQSQLHCVGLKCMEKIAATNDKG